MPGSSEFLVKPRRTSEFGGPPSTIHFSMVPSGSVTSMWIQACGLIHSISVTVPSSWIGLLASNSAPKAWCARGAAADRPNRHAAPAAAGGVLHSHEHPSRYGTGRLNGPSSSGSTNSRHLKSITCAPASMRRYSGMRMVQGRSKTSGSSSVTS